MYNVIIATNQSATTTVLSFSLTGQNGTFGFSNITIAKNSVPYGKTPAVYIDDQLAPNQGFSQDDNNYYVWYTTHFSTHQIQIVFTSASAPQSNTTQGQTSLLEIIYGVGAGAATVTIIVVALVLITRARKPKTQSPLNSA